MKRIETHAKCVGYMLNELQPGQVVEGETATAIHGGRSYRARHLWAALIAVLLGLGVFIYGHSHPIGLDPSSENQILNESASMQLGRHRWGIVEYTHYPNGPVYAALLGRWIGLTNLRLVPVGFSALCIALAAFGLIRVARIGMAIALPLAFVLLCTQPGLRNWYGALHEQSYQMALVFLACGAAATIHGFRWVAFALGFVSGWVGYDFLLVTAFAVFAVRWAFHVRVRCRPVWLAAEQSVADCAVFCAGFTLSLALHLLQNVLYFQSASFAVADLFSAFTFRAGIEVRPPSVWHSLVPDYLRTFLHPAAMTQYTNVLQYGLIAAMLTAGAMVDAVLIVRDRGKGTVGSRVLRAAIAIGGAMLLSTAGALAWLIFAPNHAAHHFHFMPRLFFVPLIATAAAVTATLGFTTVQRHEEMPDQTTFRSEAGAYLAATLSLAALGLLIGIRGPIDSTFYRSIWNHTDAGIDLSATNWRRVPAYATANALNASELAAPLCDKTNVSLLNASGFWGAALMEPANNWFTGRKTPPYIYEAVLEKPSTLDAVAIRFWGPAMRNGDYTPTRLTVDIQGEDGTWKPVGEYPGDRNAERTERGKYLGLLFKLKSPVEAEALRVICHGTLGNQGLMLNDLIPLGETRSQSERGVLWLSDMATSANTPELLRDRNEDGDPLRTDGCYFQKALAISFGTSFTINVPSHADEFRATVGADNEDRKSVQWRVLVDGNEVANSSNTTGSELALPLSGIGGDSTLSLVADGGTTEQAVAHAITRKQVNASSSEQADSDITAPFDGNTENGRMGEHSGYWYAGKQFPATADATFAAPVRIDAIDMKFWGPEYFPQLGPKHQPANYHFEGLIGGRWLRLQAGRTTKVVQSDGRAVVSHSLATPTEISGLRFVCEASLGGFAPVINEFTLRLEGTPYAWRSGERMVWGNPRIMRHKQ